MKRINVHVGVCSFVRLFADLCLSLFPGLVGCLFLCVLVCFSALAINLMGYALCRWPRPLLIALGLQVLGIVARGSWHFWYANLSFCMLGGCTLAPWDDLGTLGRITKDTLGSSRGFLFIVWGPHFEICFGTLDQKRCSCSCLFGF